MKLNEPALFWLDSWVDPRTNTNDVARENARAVGLHIAALQERLQGFEAMRRTIESERMTWAMTCECYCPACTRLDTLLRTGTTPSGGADRDS